MGKLGLDIDKGLYLGIDFGTTNSVVSVYNYDDGQVHTIPIEGSFICPTAIAFDEDFDEDEKLEKIVGLQAKEGAVIYPESTILGVKRLISQDQSIPVIVEGKQFDFAPVQIAGEIINYLKNQADEYVREQFGINGIFSGCVITVPANSVDKQKKRMKEAAGFAGFTEEQVHIRLEPAAAAIAYATTISSNKNVLVYDFGGGTFDACVLRIEAGSEEPSISILSTYGDNILGGNDMDKIVMDMIYTEFCTLTNNEIDLYDFSKDDGLSKKHKMMARARLNQVATAMKERLSSSKATKIVMAPFIQEPKIININMDITVV
jgi:molecular chaperone DnaK